MKVIIEPQAAKILKEKLSQKQKDYAIKVYSKACGWDGPKPELSLYETGENDVVYEVEGIKVVVDKEISDFAEGIQIIYGPSYFGNGFSVRFIGERGYNR
jgi:Fe-S cluster assembly iron-binding protein IscA